MVLDLIAAGQWDRAEQIGAACLEMAQRIPSSQLRRHQLLADLGVLAAGRGDLETALRYAAEVRAWSKQRGLQRLLDGADRIVVRVGIAEADYEAAYHAAVRISPPGHWPLHNIHEVADDMLDSVEAALHSGRPDEARALTDEAVRLNLAEISPRVAALTIAISAMTAPDADAGELYQSALTHPGIADFPFEHARIALAQGMWLRRMRRYTEARAALGVAADGFDRLGARPWTQRAGAELRAAGASAKKSLGEPGPLSAQQRRIAELAADGQTSKEIATHLSISARTVDGHLYRAFRKLGITSRGGLSKALLHYDSGTTGVGNS
jgi:DNA-binding CsgD family transcriptional regulator